MPINFDLFHDPRYGGEGIARSWIAKAANIRELDEPFTQFDRFLYLWMAFNAWGMCVTLADSDAGMIKILKKDERVTRVFNEAVRNRTLLDRIETIEDSFPLPSFSDLIRTDPTYNWRGERNPEYWKRIAASPLKRRVRVSPSLDHRNLNWEDTLECMYMVRCNFIHGGKMATRDEANFVGVFSYLLESILSNHNNSLLELR